MLGRQYLQSGSIKKDLYSVKDVIQKVSFISRIHIAFLKVNVFCIIFLGGNRGQFQKNELEAETLCVFRITKNVHRNCRKQLHK